MILVMGLLPCTAAAVGEEPGVYSGVPKEIFYGRQLLAAMENTEALLYAYDRVVDGIEAGEEDIPIFNGEDPISREELQLVMDLVYRDCMAFFWYKGWYSYSYDSKTVLSVKPQYSMSKGQRKQAVKEFLVAADLALAGVKPGMTQYETALYLHDCLAGRVAYVITDNCHNAYGALVEGLAVCDGYSTAYGYLLQRCGIQSFLAVGNYLEPDTGDVIGHAWNYVRIEDHYHQTDVTWDDQNEYLFHEYFNRTGQIMEANHWPDVVEYPLPDCDNCEEFYYTGSATYLQEYDVSTVAQCLKDGGYRAYFYIAGDKQSFVNWISQNILAISMELGIQGPFSYSWVNLDREFLLMLLLPDTYVRGRIQSPGGDSVTVELLSGDRVIGSLTLEGENPEYTFEGIQPGNYLLRIQGEGCIEREVPISVGPEEAVLEHRLFLQGDINADDKLNNKDVTRLMQYLAGWSVTFAEDSLDVNGDGKLNNKDVTRLMQYLAGWDVRIYQ